MYAIVGSKSAQLLMKQPDFKIYAKDFVGRKIFNVNKHRIGVLRDVNIYIDLMYPPDTIDFFEVSNIYDQFRCKDIVESLIYTDEDAGCYVRLITYPDSSSILGILARPE